MKKIPCFVLAALFLLLTACGTGSTSPDVSGIDTAQTTAPGSTITAPISETPSSSTEDSAPADHQETFTLPEPGTTDTASPTPAAANTPKPTPEAATPTTVSKPSPTPTPEKAPAPDPTPTSAPASTPTPAPASTPAPAPTPTPVPERQQSGTYVGSVESDKYHYPTCRFAKKILPENEIWFGTADEAKAAGYSACGVCKP